LEPPPTPVGPIDYSLPAVTTLNPDDFANITPGIDYSSLTSVGAALPQSGDGSSFTLLPPSQPFDFGGINAFRQQMLAGDSELNAVLASALAAPAAQSGGGLWWNGQYVSGSSLGSGSLTGSATSSSYFCTPYDSGGATGWGDTSGLPNSLGNLTLDGLPSFTTVEPGLGDATSDLNGWTLGAKAADTVGLAFEAIMYLANAE
jgi:hypothetical protein